MSDYRLNLFGKYLALALLALGLDLLWGYTGILRLGQAIFFGIGAYSIGMYMLLESSGQGVYGEAIPDFMVWNQVTELPAFWKPFRSFPFAIASAVLLPALLAAVIGLVTFRAPRGRHLLRHPQPGHRLRRVADAQPQRDEPAADQRPHRLQVAPRLLAGRSGTHGALYVVTALVLLAAFVARRWLMRSKTGLVLTPSATTSAPGVPRLRHRAVQDPGLRHRGGARRARRAALRAPGRHHHAEPGGGAAVPGGGHLGGLRRARNPAGAPSSAPCHQLAPRSVLTDLLPRLLADHPRRAVRGGHHVRPRGRDGLLGRLARAAGARAAGRREEPD